MNWTVESMESYQWGPSLGRDVTLHALLMYDICKEYWWECFIYHIPTLFALLISFCLFWSIIFYYFNKWQVLIKDSFSKIVLFTQTLNNVKPHMYIYKTDLQYLIITKIKRHTKSYFEIKCKIMMPFVRTFLNINFHEWHIKGHICHHILKIAHIIFLKL